MIYPVCLFSNNYVLLFKLQGSGPKLHFQEEYPAKPKEQVRIRLREAFRELAEGWHLRQLRTLRLASLMLDSQHVLTSLAAADLPALRDLQLHGFHACDGPLDPSPLMPLMGLSSLGPQLATDLGEHGKSDRVGGNLASGIRQGNLRSLGLNCGDASLRDPGGLLAEADVEALMSLPELSVAALSIKLPLQLGIEEGRRLGGSRAFASVTSLRLSGPHPWDTMRPLLQPIGRLRRLWLEQLQLPFPSRWYNASSSCVQLEGLKEVMGLSGHSSLPQISVALLGFVVRL